jgi:hypothetical protein
MRNDKPSIGDAAYDGLIQRAKKDDISSNAEGLLSLV